MSCLRHGTLVCLALTAACAPSPGPAPTAPAAPVSVPGAPAPVAPAEPQPERGGSFQIIGIRDLPHLHPWSNVSPNIQFYLRGVYQQLLAWDYKPFQDWREEYRLTPSLAERWELKDGSTYTLNLQKGVKWHDGQPFTSRDVQWSFEQLMDPANAYEGRSPLQNVASTAVLDDHTLQIVTKTPDVTFLGSLTEHTASIAPQHVLARGDKFEQVAVGTGPFKVESHDRQKGVTYVPNKDYWQPGRPYVDRWKVFPTQDPAGRTAAFIARQNDVLKLTDKPQVDPIVRAAPQTKSLAFLRDISMGLSFRLDRPPFNDIRVRRAIHLAIDRQAMVQGLTFGAGVFNPPGVNAARKSMAMPKEELEKLPGWRQPKDQDIAEAKRLLAEAGYSDRLSFTVKVDVGNVDGPIQAEAAVAQLQKIGIDAKLAPLESGIFDKTIYTDRDFESYVWSLDYTAPERSWQRDYHSKGSKNVRPINDPELDRLIEGQAREFDENKRKQLILDIQRLLLKELYIAPLITYPGYLLWQPYVHGWIDNQAGQAATMDWSQLWLSVGDLPKDRS